MSAIGRITVPTPAASSSVFPLVTDYDYAFSQARPVVLHRIGSANSKIEQRFEVGIGPNRYGFRQAHMTQARRTTLLGFWENRQGAYESFLYDAPQPSGGVSRVRVYFENTPINFQHMLRASSVGMSFIEVPDPSSAPTYTITSTCTRFPSDALKTALLDQVQKIVPLLKIRVMEAAVDSIYVSDRLCTVGSQVYQARLTNVGDPQSDVLISQDMSGQDSVRFVLGNADRVMTKLANDTRLFRAWVEFSLLHVNTGILVNLWAGQIVDWQSNAGPEFTIQCADPIYDLSYPPRQVSRTCWKDVGDQVTCFAALVDGLPPPCDRSWANCVTLSQQVHFGGQVAQPQGVHILDNKSGTWGFGRNAVTATSIVADTIMGQALPEIWHHSEGDILKTLPVNCLIAAGRDESDFFDALGIVGAGPIGGFATPQMVDNGTNSPKKTLMVAHLLDGSPHQGFHVDSDGNPAGDMSSLGLRYVLGADPVNESLGDDHGSFGLGEGSPQAWSAPYRAAGTAFIEMRKPKEKGIAPTPNEQHSMQAVVETGLTGWTWASGAGSRTTWAGCFDPFWVAINTYLRGRGAHLAGEAAQEALFDVTAAVSCAAEAGTSVDQIVGSTTERQFAFKGVIGATGQTKALRDWLNDILAGACGYYTWSFGRLRLGIRTMATAGAVEAFSAGNILFGSLSLNPVKPAFEKLVMSFADQEYRFQANTADYTDFDLARLNNRPLAPVTSQMHLPGCPSKSQALRVAVTRTREEAGGCYRSDLANPLIEYNEAREGSWKSTILALNTEPGMVVSLTHDDLISSGNTTGNDKFRVQGWRLFRDYSIQFQVRTVTNSCYDLTVGNVPSDVAAAPIPQEPTRDTSTPPAPVFTVESSALDSTAAELAGLSFATPENTDSITAATFAIYYTDEANGPMTTLAAALGSSDLAISLADGSSFPEGSLAQIHGEVILIGASGAIARAQLGTAADSHADASTVLLVKRLSTVSHFPIGYFATDEAASWNTTAVLADQRLAAVTCYVTNRFGDSPVTTVCVTANIDYGIRLTSGAGLLPGETLTLTNADAVLSGVQRIVKVSATTRACNVTLQNEAAMTSLSVKVVRNAGSTYDVNVVPASGDDIDDSSSATVLSADGEERIFSAV